MKEPEGSGLSGVQVKDMEHLTAVMFPVPMHLAMYLFFAEELALLARQFVCTYLSLNACSQELAEDEESVDDSENGFGSKKALMQSMINEITSNSIA